jgi:hypothetical protein
MRKRSFADLVAGVLACISVIGCCAVLGRSERFAGLRRGALRWSLPRRRRRSPEDDCRHCTGSGSCAGCAPAACRVCRGTGSQPRDEATVARLSALWNPAN